jgi:hypothetical protein
VDFLECAGETVLDEIVSGDHIARQSTRVTLELWDQA